MLRYIKAHFLQPRLIEDPGPVTSTNPLLLRTRLTAVLARSNALRSRGSGDSCGEERQKGGQEGGVVEGEKRRRRDHRI